jgi:hypothetical protein
LIRKQTSNKKIFDFIRQNKNEFLLEIMQGKKIRNNTGYTQYNHATFNKNRNYFIR